MNPPFGDPRLPARFWSKVQPSPSGCWTWTRSCSTDGYGQFGFQGKLWGAHRLAYETLVEPIEDGAVIDHTCHNGTACRAGKRCPHRRCVNPGHMEPTTRLDNLDRSHDWTRNRTHCKRGRHPLSGDNLGVTSQGGRFCRICRANSQQRYKARKRAAR